MPKEGGCINYINADLIAAGLSPFAPENVSVMAGKLMIQEIEKCAAESKSFAFETTLSGLSYVDKINRWKREGYEIVLYYFSLLSVQIAIDRVKTRVAQGGHDIPDDVIARRFYRSQKNLKILFKPIVDAWVVFDTSSSVPTLIDKSSNYE